MKRALYIIFVPCLIAILTVSILHPQNNLIPGRIFVYMLAWVFLLFAVRLILGLMERLLIKKDVQIAKFSRVTETICLLLYGVALYYVSVLLRADPVTDYKAVYDTALSLAGGDATGNWDYFSMWTNNLGVLTVLAAGMKAGISLGFADPFYFVLGLNVLQMVVCMGCISYLAGIFFPEKYSMRWFAMAVFTLWTPVWSSANAFYSDQLSFSGSLIAFTLWICASRKFYNSTWKKAVCLTCAGLFWGMAACVKATAAISLVAFIILWLLNAKEQRGFIEIFWILAMAALVVKGFGLYKENYPSAQNEYRLKMPTEYWIAMGLEGNGTYAENGELVQMCLSSPNADVRQKNCRAVIREKWKNIFDAEHMTRKISAIFASGDIQPTSLTYPVRETVLWQCFDTEGEYYWKYTCTSTGFFYAVLLLLILGGLLQIFRYGQDDFMFFHYLTIFGLFLFLMLWEAQNKQLFNHIPWLTLAVLCGIHKIECVITESRKTYDGTRSE